MFTLLVQVFAEVLALIGGLLCSLLFFCLFNCSFVPARFVSFGLTRFVSFGPALFAFPFQLHALHVSFLSPNYLLVRFSQIQGRG